MVYPIFLHVIINSSFYYVCELAIKRIEDVLISFSSGYNTYRNNLVVIHSCFLIIKLKTKDCSVFL